MKRKLMRSLGLALTCGVALISLASCGGKTTKAAKTETPEKEGYNVLWSDEFDGKKLDENIWHREEREKGWTNQELQKYTSDEKNGFIRDGKFVIKGYEDEVGTDTTTDTSTYSSCKLRNNDDHSFKYGRVEVSAKTPTGYGLWPAIWMMPEKESLYGQWPKCGEIDIMEVLGDNVSKAYGTLHWGEPHAEKQGNVVLDGDNTFASDFHEYAIEWEPGRIEWFIDGTSYLVVDDWFTAVDGGEEKPFPAPFNQNFCIQINLAIGGSWPGNPEPGADYIKDAEFEIDYVRVYQKTEGYDESSAKKPEKQFRSPDETGNYITNSDFQGDIYANEGVGTVGWVTYKDGGKFTTSKFDDENGKGIAINITKKGDKEYSVQLFHTAMPFLKGKTYKISFDAWTDSADGFKIKEVCVDAPNAGWQRYWKSEVDLTTEKQTFEYTFLMEKKDDEAARFEFNMGKSAENVTIYLSNVRVEMVEA